MSCYPNAQPTSQYLVGCPKNLTIGQIAASSTGSIPAGASDWSFTIIGANGTVNTIAMGTGTVLSGNGTLTTAIAFTTGTTTTINYSYQS